MSWSLVIACLAILLAAAGWVLAELELRDTRKALEQTERDLVVALAWDQIAEEAIERAARQTLSLIDGGKA